MEASSTSKPTDEWCHRSRHKNNKKKDLNIITTNHLFIEKRLYVYLIEIESIKKGPQLTPLRCDVNNFEVLTPNHVLTGTANPNLLMCPLNNMSDINNKWKWKTVQAAKYYFGRDRYATTRHLIKMCLDQTG